MAERNAGRGDAEDNTISRFPFASRKRDGGPVPMGESAPAGRAAARPRKRATATSHSELGEKLIAGVPARIMRPRLVFLACLIAICAFGLLMVYSASAVEALKEQGSSTYYLFRQSIFMGIGFVVLALISSRSVMPWRAFSGRFVMVAWGTVVALLVIVLAIGAGGDTWGASRWIPLGFFNLQPAELAKPAVVLLAAKILSEYYEERSTDTPAFLFWMLLCLGVPAVLIVLEPDLGTTIIVCATVFAMAYVCGISYRVVFGTIAVCAVLVVILAFVSPYRFARLLVFMDPWSDPYGDGYQATLAIMAFASGGPFGRGIGNATMKYHYLPEAHNDYILAIIGEELGFVGTLAFVVVFMAMIAAGFCIARRSPSLHGQLIATGSSFALLIQFLINSLGILGLMPMTGKPLPFISYGGSAVLTSLILAGLIFRVSVESNVETTADRRRAGLSVMGQGGSRTRRSAESGLSPREQDDVSTHVGRSTAGPARPRSARRDGGFGGFDEPGERRGSALSVYDGGRADARVRPSRRGREDDRPRGAVSRSGRDGGYGRIDLGASAQDRLRSRDAGPRVDYADEYRAPRPRRSGDAAREGRRQKGRGWNDR